MKRLLLLFCCLFGTVYAWRCKATPADTLQALRREVTVSCDGFSLPGTLTLPAEASRRRVPCVVLVHGSGSNDRDETIGPNKPFRDLADGLAARGIATLRYDKRTFVYKQRSVPTGRELDYDTEVTDDAVAAVALAASLPEVAPDSVYLLGHSLGGTLAPRIAERSGRLAGIIILAGLVRSLGDALVEQVEYILSLQGGLSDEARSQVETLRRQVENMKRLDTFEYNASLPLPMGIPASYWRMALQYKPAEVASRLSLPMLVLQGERDYQVTMIDFGLWQVNLMFNSRATFKSYPQLNHLMQEGEGKAVPAEYQQPRPVAREVIDDVARFVHR